MPDLQGIKKARNKGKKKNPGPQDFKKQKVKVGRKLVKKNETSTTIKSRKLNLQKQSVAVDRSGKEVNSRGLTLVEILSHSTHYNANMRKECLAGIRDFFELHPVLLSLHVGAVVTHTAPSRTLLCLVCSSLRMSSASDKKLCTGLAGAGKGVRSAHRPGRRSAQGVPCAREEAPARRRARSHGAAPENVYRPHLCRHVTRE